jgi:uncharacterized protein (DUF924 family)
MSFLPRGNESRARGWEWNVETPRSILDFWFGPAGEANQIAGRQSPLWWSKSDERDLDIRRRFQDTLEMAASGELDSWAGTPEGLLSLVILVDQFPRNIYRAQARCFSFDSLARRWCRQGLGNGIDRLLTPIQRVFFYLPLEHSEELTDQNQSVALFSKLTHEVREEEESLFQGYLDYALRHREIIDRFGRYPHRNQLLARESTPEELVFLEQPGSSF